MAADIEAHLYAEGYSMCGRALLVALAMVAAPLLISACESGADGPPPNDTPCGELCDAQCEKQRACDETISEEHNTLCLENCAQIEENEWGTTLLMTPLACSAYEECLDFRFCVLLGGEAGFACGGNQPDDVTAPQYEESCAGLCDYQIACDNQSAWYRQDCIENCQQSLRGDWLNPLVLRCANALDCSRLTRCVNEIYYGSFDNSPDVDLPPDAGEPRPEEIEGDIIDEE
jgi:hypothetical protein